MERDVTDFPDPLSPTMAATSPLFTFSDTFLTACVNSPSFWKSIERLLIVNRSFNIISVYDQNLDFFSGEMTFIEMLFGGVG